MRLSTIHSQRIIDRNRHCHFCGKVATKHIETIDGARFAADLCETCHQRQLTRRAEQMRAEARR